MNSVLILVFHIFASTQAEPDTHIHVHIPPEEIKGAATSHNIQDLTLTGKSPFGFESEAGMTPTKTTPPTIENGNDYGNEGGNSEHLRFEYEVIRR